MSEHPKKGEVWRIRHARKGTFCVLLTADYDPAATWIDATVATKNGVEGLAEDWLYGESIPLRGEFTTFLERVMYAAAPSEGDGGRNG